TRGCEQETSGSRHTRQPWPPARQIGHTRGGRQQDRHRDREQGVQVEGVPHHQGDSGAHPFPQPDGYPYTLDERAWTRARGGCQRGQRHAHEDAGEEKREPSPHRDRRREEDAAERRRGHGDHGPCEPPPAHSRSRLRLKKRPTARTNVKAAVDATSEMIAPVRPRGGTNDSVPTIAVHAPTKDAQKTASVRSKACKDAPNTEPSALKTGAKPYTASNAAKCRYLSPKARLSMSSPKASKRA